MRVQKQDNARSLSDVIRIHYPLATIVDGASRVSRCDVEAAPWSHRSVGVAQVHDEGEVVQRIVAAYRGGQAVAWVRNTVDSVLDAAEMLRSHGIDPMVFHSRFAQADRQQREVEVMAAFGKNSVSAERNRVVVATQVIEQSLNLDFDCLVSDLAPIDLLIQRAGRLWRHQRQRPEGSKLELLVLAPPFEDDPGSRWLDEVLPKTKYVYEDVAVLWRTQRELVRVGRIVTPGGVRDLVETVYVDDFVPASLEAASQRVRGKSAALRMMARHFSLDWERGYAGGSSTDWYADIRVPTRLAEEKTVVRLARLTSDNRVVPWAEGLGDGDDWKAWALSEVRVSERTVSRAAGVASRHAGRIDVARHAWPKYERDVLVIVLEADQGGFAGGYVAGNGSTAVVRYSCKEGLRL
jgi:CRISPR-associated endonuclease/helicase Cas3